MKKYPKEFIEHIRESIHHIEIYIDHISKEKLILSNMIQDAVIRRLEIIGESINKIPLEFREEYPDISWCQIAEKIDILIHGYFDVDLDLTWNVVMSDLPELKQKVEMVLKKLDESSIQVPHKDYMKNLYHTGLMMMK